MVAEALRDRLDDMVGAVAQACESLYPAAAREERQAFAQAMARTLITCIEWQRLLTNLELAALDVPKFPSGSATFQAQRAVGNAVRLVWTAATEEADRIAPAQPDLNDYRDRINLLMLGITHQLSLAGLARRLASETVALDIEGPRHPIAWLVDPSTSQPDRERFARDLGIDPRRSHTVVVFGPTHDESGLDQLARANLRPMEGAAGALGHEVIWVVRAPIGGDSRLVPLIEEALRGLAGAAGISRTAHRIDQLPSSYHQAVEALSVSSLGRSLPAALTFDEALPYQLLRSDAARAIQMMQMALDPLIIYDERRTTNLVETVEAFLTHSSNYAKAAEALNIHRHTLHDRVLRIEQLTGMRLDHHEDVMLFALAVRAWRLLRSTG